MFASLRVSTQQLSIHQILSQTLARLMQRLSPILSSVNVNIDKQYIIIRVDGFWILLTALFTRSSPLHTIEWPQRLRTKCNWKYCSFLQFFSFWIEDVFKQLGCEYCLIKMYWLGQFLRLIWYPIYYTLSRIIDFFSFLWTIDTGTYLKSVAKCLFL